MPIMYCHFNMFDMTSSVLATNENSENVTVLFTGTFEDLCEFMAAEYQTHKYEKIVLAGPYANAVEDRVRTYSKTNYNFDNINIEVM